MRIKGVVFRDLVNAMVKGDCNSLSEWFYRAMVASNWSMPEMELLLDFAKSIEFNREVSPFAQSNHRIHIYQQLKDKNPPVLARMICSFLAINHEDYLKAKSSFVLDLEDLIRTAPRSGYLTGGRGPDRGADARTTEHTPAGG